MWGSNKGTDKALGNLENQGANTQHQQDHDNYLKYEQRYHNSGGIHIQPVALSTNKYFVAYNQCVRVANPVLSPCPTPLTVW